MASHVSSHFVHDVPPDRLGDVVTVLEMEMETKEIGTLPQGNVVLLARKHRGEYYGPIEDTAQVFPLAKKYGQALSGNMAVNREQLERNVTAKDNEISTKDDKIKELNRDMKDGGEISFDSLLEDTKCIKALWTEIDVLKIKYTGMESKNAGMEADMANMFESNKKMEADMANMVESSKKMEADMANMFESSKKMLETNTKLATKMKRIAIALNEIIGED